MVLEILRKMAVNLPVIIILFAVAGCGGKSFDYHSDNEIPNRPGVFSKEPEGYTVYDSETGWTPKDSAEAPGSGKEVVDKSGDDSKTEGSAIPVEESAEMKEYREFQEFQKWTKEKKEFEEFQEWKKSKQGAKEYREFLEWKKWKEYKKWQENQQ